MPRRRKFIRSKRPYEIILRAIEGLPFPAIATINLIIQSALARTQRDGGKLTLCHYLWMGNHVHMIVVALDAQECFNFYQELQKKITDALKRLLGVHRLHIWEGDPIVAEILDVDAVINTIAYIYANPAKANLVDSVHEYPGLSSLSAFKKCLNSGIQSVSWGAIPWIRLPSINKAPARSLSDRQDQFLVDKLLAKAKESHPLEIFPNAWMDTFGIEDQVEVQEINERILALIEDLEQEAREKRINEGKRLIGKERLKRQPILMPHIPKKRERRIFVISTIKELRIAYIEMYNAVCDQCAECLRAWRYGIPMPMWPPGTYMPSFGVVASALE